MSAPRCYTCNGPIEAGQEYSGTADDPIHIDIRNCYLWIESRRSSHGKDPQEIARTAAEIWKCLQTISLSQKYCTDFREGAIEALEWVLGQHNNDGFFDGVWKVSEYVRQVYPQDTRLHQWVTIMERLNRKQ